MSIVINNDIEDLKQRVEKLEAAVEDKALGNLAAGCVVLTDLYQSGIITLEEARYNIATAGFADIEPYMEVIKKNAEK